MKNRTAVRTRKLTKAEAKVFLAEIKAKGISPLALLKAARESREKREREARKLMEEETDRLMKAKTFSVVQLWDGEGLWLDEHGRFYTGKCADHSDDEKPVGPIEAVTVEQAARWYIRWSPPDVSEDGTGSANPILQALLRKSTGPAVPIEKVMSSRIRPETYGALCEAGLRHGGMGPDEMLDVLLNRSNVVVNWCNDGFPTDLNKAERKS